MREYEFSAKQTWRKGMNSTDPGYLLDADTGMLVANAEYDGLIRLRPRREFEEVFSESNPVPVLVPLVYSPPQRVVKFNEQSARLYVAGAQADSFNPGLSSFSIAFYVKTAQANVTLVEKFSGFSGWRVHISPYGRVLVTVGDGATTQTTPDDGVAINDDRWHCVIINVSRGGNITRYIDGLPSGTSVSLAVGLISNAADFRIGGFVGMIAHVLYGTQEVDAVELTREGLRPVPGTKSFYTFDGALPSPAQVLRDKAIAGKHLSWSGDFTIEIDSAAPRVYYRTLVFGSSWRPRRIAGFDEAEPGSERVFVEEVWNGLAVRTLELSGIRARSACVYQGDVFFSTDSGVFVFDPEAHEIVACGVSAPTSAPTPVVGTAGTLFPSGRVYKYRVTFVRHLGNRIVESNPGPESAPVSTGNTSRSHIVLNNIPTGPSGVTARCVYRAQSTDGQVFSPYQLVFCIENNTTTTFTDTIAESVWGMNPILGVDNHAPPSGRLVSVFLDRLIVADSPTSPDIVWYSKLQKPEQFSRLDGLAMDEGDVSRGRVSALMPSRDALYVFKPDATYALIPTSDDARTPFARVIVDRNRGTWASRGVTTEGDAPVVLTPEGPATIMGGRYQFVFSLPVLTEMTSRLRSTDAAYVNAVNVPELHSVVFAIGDRMYLYDYLRGLWHVWEIGDQELITALAVLPEQQREDILLVATWDGTRARVLKYPGNARAYMTLKTRTFVSASPIVLRALAFAGGRGRVSVEVWENDQLRERRELVAMDDPLVVHVNVVSNSFFVKIFTNSAAVDYMDLLGHVRTEEGRRALR